MTNTLSRLLLCVVLVGITSGWTFAQDENSNTKSEVRSITGCLTKSGNGNQCRLTASDGSTSQIDQNGSVNLAEHVGQTVEIKGTVSQEKMHNMKEDAKGMGHDAGAKNNTAEHGHLNVTDIHRVGESCEL